MSNVFDEPDHGVQPNESGSEASTWRDQNRAPPATQHDWWTRPDSRPHASPSDYTPASMDQGFEAPPGTRAQLAPGEEHAPASGTQPYGYADPAYGSRGIGDRWLDDRDSRFSNDGSTSHPPASYPQAAYPPITQPDGRPAPGRQGMPAGIAAALTLVVIGAIGVGAYALLGHRSHGPGHQAGGGPSASPAAGLVHHGNLRRYLVAAPRGSHGWPHPLGTNRTLSLTQVAHLSTDHKARRALLTRDHFTHGAVQCWIAKSGTWVDVRLYQFGSADDAQSFFRADIASSETTTPRADQSSVSGVRDARVFATSKPDSNGYISVLVIGVKGDVTFVVDLAEKAKKARLVLPDSLARAQYRRL